jgi:ATP-dependent DNA helicase PIF1
MDEIFRQSLTSKSNILLHGPGGTGKSTRIHEIMGFYLNLGVKIDCTSSTGITAINLCTEEYKATTLHKWIGLGLFTDDVDKSVEKINKNIKLRIKHNTTKVLIIDEISMISGALFNKLNAVLKRIRRSPLPMGGIKVIVSGDFLQLPPVEGGWIFDSAAWQEMNFKIFNFEEPKRYPDLDWFNLLLRIRKGKATHADVELLKTREQAYLNLIEDENGIKPTILFSTRKDVNYLNDYELEKITTDSKEMKAVDSSYNIKTFIKTPEYQAVFNDVIPDKLVFKVGAQVMLKVNLDTDLGLANGTRGVIIEIEPSLKVRWFNGIVTIVEPYTWEIKDEDLILSRTQIPLVLAWALTIHKSQGSTLDYVICDLGESMFASGQAYVALSRVKTLNGLLISQLNEKCLFKQDEKALAYVNATF